MTFYFFRYAKGKLVVAMTSAAVILMASTAVILMASATVTAAGTIFVVMLAVMVTVGASTEV